MKRIPLLAVFTNRKHILLFLGRLQYSSVQAVFIWPAVVAASAKQSAWHQQGWHSVKHLFAVVINGGSRYQADTGFLTPILGGILFQQQAWPRRYLGLTIIVPQVVSAAFNCIDTEAVTWSDSYDTSLIDTEELTIRETAAALE